MQKTVTEGPAGHILPAGSRPVSLARKIASDGGMQLENYEWLPYLADGVGKRCVGRDARSIPVEILSAAGHPPRPTRQLVTAFAKGDGGDCLTWRQDVREYRDIRRHVCLPCVDGNDAEVRRCTTINCPFWPYRMGVNPHNPQRGRNPFPRES
jgi:hypothetical protein